MAEASIMFHRKAGFASWFLFPAQSLQYVWLEGWSEDYQRPFFLQPGDQAEQLG